MAELTAIESVETDHEWARRRVSEAFRGPSLPERLDDLRPIQLGLLFREMERSTSEPYPTELFDAMRSLDDCIHYMAVKRTRS